MAAQRKFDVVLYGATGFTGRFIAVELLRNVAAAAQDEKEAPRIAFAGRSQAKLKDVVDSVVKEVQFKGVVHSIIASSEDEQSIIDMVSSTRLIISGVGPFRLYGEPIVRACAKAGTHYVDISGETEFIINMGFKYHEEAKANNALIVSACGFDCIPSELGAVYLSKKFAEKKHLLSHIDSFFTLQTGQSGMVANSGTWESLVYGLGSANNLRNLRKQLHAKRGAEPVHIGPNSVVPKLPFFDKRVTNKWSLVFPGADATIVRNSQQLRAMNGDVSPQPRYSIFFTVPSFLYVVLLVLFGIYLFIMSSFRVVRRQMIKHPRLFSFGSFSSRGPSDAQIRETTFKMEMLGRGYKTSDVSATANRSPDVFMRIAVEGADPGYRATATMCVQAALCILHNEATLPRGVVTPGAAFDKTDLIDSLHRAGLTFTVTAEGDLA